MRSNFTTDGTLIRQTLIDNNGVLHGRLLQPERLAILKHNAELRRNPEAWKKTDFGMRTELSIPEVDYHYLLKKYPALGSTNAQEKSLAWKKFMQSSECDPYRVRDKKRLVKC